MGRPCIEGVKWCRNMTRREGLEWQLRYETEKWAVLDMGDEM
jgi:hypothetical protein